MGDSTGPRRRIAAVGLLALQALIWPVSGGSSQAAEITLSLDVRTAMLPPNVSTATLMSKDAIKGVAAPTYVAAFHAVSMCGEILLGRFAPKKAVPIGMHDPDLAIVTTGRSGSAEASEDRKKSGRATSGSAYGDEVFRRGEEGIAIGMGGGRITAIEVLANRLVNLELHDRHGLYALGRAQAWSIVSSVDVSLRGMSGGVIVAGSGELRGTIVGLDRRRGRLVVVPWPETWRRGWRPLAMNGYAQGGSDAMTVARDAARSGRVLLVSCGTG